jgi:hypothetical protein
MSDRGPFEAWQVDEGPSRGFAERVVAEAMASPRRTASRQKRWIGAAMAVTLAAAAATALFVHGSPTTAGVVKGEATASAQRVEIPVGARATAVLESGAHLSWSGDEVVQSAGDVFYRVERRGGGAPFVVHTPAGDVTVLGTCFRVKVSEMNRRDMKVATVGAAMGAMAFVGVYEGHVAVSHAQQTLDVRAGESAQIDARGPHATGDLAAGEKAMAQASAEQPRDPLLAANANLAGQVQQYRSALADNEQARKALEAQLKAAQTKLDAQNRDGAPARDPYDLTPEDWKRMADEGTFVAHYPCGQDDNFKPSDDLMNAAGLSPDEAPAVTAAYQRAQQQVNDVVNAACTAVVGADMASRLGPGTCEAVVRGSQKGAASSADIERVARIRAGELPMPAPNDPSVDPLERMLLAQSGAMPAFEKDLAQAIGPEAAHSVATSDALGGCQTAFRTKGRGPVLPPR